MKSYNTYVLSFATTNTAGNSGLVTVKVNAGSMEEAWKTAKLDGSGVDLGVNVVSAELVRNLTKTFC